MEELYDVPFVRAVVVFRKKLGSVETGKVEIKGVPCVPPVLGGDVDEFWRETKDLESSRTLPNSTSKNSHS
jgi:hypothetical protein